LASIYSNERLHEKHKKQKLPSTGPRDLSPHDSEPEAAITSIFRRGTVKRSLILSLL
jgi:hypothetical protein